VVLTGAHGADDAGAPAVGADDHAGPLGHGTATGVPTVQPHDDAVVDDDLVERGVGCVAEQGSPHNRPGAGRREDPRPCQCLVV
jgi:hypothetical protein